MGDPEGVLEGVLVVGDAGGGFGAGAGGGAASAAGGGDAGGQDSEISVAPIGNVGVPAGTESEMTWPVISLMVTTHVVADAGGSAAIPRTPSDAAADATATASF